MLFLIESNISSPVKGYKNVVLKLIIISKKKIMFMSESTVM